MKQILFMHYFKKYAGYFVTALIALCISVLLDLLCPQIVRRIVDDVIINQNIKLLTPLLLSILGIGVGRCVFQYVKEMTCDAAGSKIGGEVRNEIFTKLQSLSADFFDGINSGELMARVKDDVDRIWDIFTYIGILITEVIVHTAIALYFMYSLNWRLSIIPTLAMAAAAVIAILMERELGHGYERMAEENSIMNNTAAENLAGVRTVKAFTRELFEADKFRAHNERYYTLTIEQSKIFVRYNPLLQGITYFVPSCVLVMGGFMAIRGNISIGELTAFIQYSMNIMWPMNMLGWLTNGISSARASQKRLNGIFARESTIADVFAVKDSSDNNAVITGDIVFDHVSYSGTPTADSSSDEILHDISFHVAPGETLGIMGATGSGKTTIINLLKRMYNVTAGTIRLDGMDITKMSLRRLRSNIACVMQDVFLFSDTIGNNVKLGERATLGTQSIETALAKSCSAGFVEAMKDGAETVIGERGIGLSGGQKQRLTIARALSRNAPVLVFDDSTSALDTETERQIHKMLHQLTGMTKIIIAHRISAVRSADHIIVLDKGRICERGTHEQLMQICGLYYQTYKSQY